MGSQKINKRQRKIITLSGIIAFAWVILSHPMAIWKGHVNQSLPDIKENIFLSIPFFLLCYW